MLLVAGLGAVDRPPLDGDASRELFERLSRIAADLGMEPRRSIAVGGASDGNFTAFIDDIAACALASSAPASVGTVGRFPKTPSR